MKYLKLTDDLYLRKMESTLWREVFVLGKTSIPLLESKNDIMTKYYEVVSYRDSFDSPLSIQSLFNDKCTQLDKIGISQNMNLKEMHSSFLENNTDIEIDYSYPINKRWELDDNIYLKIALDYAKNLNIITIGRNPIDVTYYKSQEELDYALRSDYANIKYIFIGIGYNTEIISIPISYIRLTPNMYTSLSSILDIDAKIISITDTDVLELLDMSGIYRSGNKTTIDTIMYLIFIQDYSQALVSAFEKCELSIELSIIDDGEIKRTIYTSDITEDTMNELFTSVTLKK